MVCNGEQKQKSHYERTLIMLIKAKALVDYKLDSLDGEIGKVKEFYFDDRHWAIRYLVADTGDWLMDRQVLISPYSLVAVNKEKRGIAIDLTKKQIEDSPSLDCDKPVSRQFEQVFYGYYAFPTYWNGPFMWGPSHYIVRDGKNGKEPDLTERPSDPHLRSTRDVSGHHIQAIDGEIGHVADFIVDDETWAIRYLVIDTNNWWPGKEVLLSPRWIERVSWEDSKVYVNLSREAIQQAPEYTEDSLLTRDYEEELHRHYDHKGYWLDEPVAKGHVTAGGRR
jgi:hypothetical protein